MGKEETEKDIQLVEGKRDHRRLGGGQSCGLKGDYTFEWAINGKIVTWTQAEFCKRFTRLAYNFDVIKFMSRRSVIYTVHNTIHQPRHHTNSYTLHDQHTT